MTALNQTLESFFSRTLPITAALGADPDGLDYARARGTSRVNN